MAGMVISVPILRLVLVMLMISLFAIPAPASAIPPWEFDPASNIAPPDTPPAAVYKMKRNRECGQSAVLENSQFETIPAQEAFNVKKLHTFARGDGQTVAVIGSGVARVSRLPNVIPGGDYVGDSNGLEDCDHHETLVAGIIAGQPSVNDGFVGVAPGATVLTIRQQSVQYTEDTSVPENQNLSPADKSAANMLTLAKSIVHAANMGATVINMSLTACVDAGHLPDLRVLAGALYYAAVEKNVVIVAAAGNTGGNTCKTNPEYDPSNPGDLRNWAQAQSVSIPSYFDRFVLSVGGTAPASSEADTWGDPYANSMPGPWVGVAAPAANIVSLDPSEPQPGALVNALMQNGNPVAENGTSFAAAYVSGLAALIRELNPGLTSNQVINRIKRTAHSPSSSVTNVFGSGIVDPVQALTRKGNDGPIVAPGIPSKAAEPYAAAVPPDTLARNVAIGVIGSAVAIVVAAYIVAMARRRHPKKEG